MSLTLAELKRKLKPGVELTLTHNYMGPCRIRRKVSRVQSNAIACDSYGDPGDFCKPGNLSWLHFGKSTCLEGTEKGFRFYDETDRESYVEYEWGHNL